MIAERVRNLGPQHYGWRIRYNRIVDGVLADIEPHSEWTGVILAGSDMRWLLPTRDEITISRTAT